MTPHCANLCGRFVWNYETGLCGQCDPETTRRREGQRFGPDRGAAARRQRAYRVRNDSPSARQKEVQRVARRKRSERERKRQERALSTQRFHDNQQR